jgi:hypothetical protein
MPPPCPSPSASGGRELAARARGGGGQRHGSHRRRGGGSWPTTEGCSGGDSGSDGAAVKVRRRGDRGGDSGSDSSPSTAASRIPLVVKSTTLATDASPSIWSSQSNISCRCASWSYADFPSLAFYMAFHISATARLGVVLST